MISEEAVLLLAGYTEHPFHPDVSIPRSRSTLAAHILLKLTDPRPYSIDTLPGSPGQDEGTWAFEGDKNAATHLVENALAGGDKWVRGCLLSMRGPITRQMRDDISVRVVRVTLFEWEWRAEWQILVLYSNRRSISMIRLDMHLY